MLENFAKLKQSRDLQACSFVNWYKQFEKLSVEAKAVAIPTDVLDYLNDEIIILPKECHSSFETESSAGFEDADTEEVDIPEFVSFSQSLTDNIIELGGAAFVKTNWKCPRDAIWITAGQTLKAQDITDIYQLLKASSVCKKDLCNYDLPSPDGQDVAQFIVMKKWRDIHPGTEFRCFVRNRRLIAISPRDWPRFHEHIVAQKRDIISDIVSVFREHIKEKFPLEDYVFDVVRTSKDNLYLMDFAPFYKEFTDFLAYDQEQLEELHNIMEDENVDDDPEFRYLPSDCGIQPNPRNNFGLPLDVINLFKNANNTDIEPTDQMALNRLIENCTEEAASDSD